MTAKHKRKDVIIYIIMTCTLLLLTAAITMHEKFRSMDGRVIITFAINGCIWFCLFVKEMQKRPYSFVLIQWFFCLAFFFLAPLAQYFKNWFPWIVVRSDDILVKTNIVLFIWTISVLFGETLAKKHFRRSSTAETKFHLSSRFLQINIMSDCSNNLEKLLPFLSCINIAVMITYLRQIGFVNLLFRSTNTGIQFSRTDTVSMVIANVLQATCFFSVAISVNRFLKNRKKFFFLLINGIILIITYFPTGLARYTVAVLYLGTMLIFFRSWRDNRFFILLFTMSFLIILPFFSVFRYGSIQNFNVFKTLKDAVLHISDNLVAYDYDAYTELSLTLEYVDTYGFGKNHILTVLLFFVPRAIWPEKSFSGAADVAHTRGLFDNVSFPFAALSYIDMGILGVIFVGIFVGYVMKKMDNRFWIGIDKTGKTVRAYDYLYNVFIVFFLFLCRGDAFYVWSFMFCYFVAWYIIVKVSSIKIRQLKRHFFVKQ